jgi:hypothetical protein
MGLFCGFARSSSCPSCASCPLQLPSFHWVPLPRCIAPALERQLAFAKNLAAKDRIRGIPVPLHGEAPPEIDLAHTITTHDLTEELAVNAQGWGQTTSETLVRYADRLRAFKTTPASAKSTYNRTVTGEARRTSLERDWITRAAQAAEHAGELAKLNAVPWYSGTATVRAEKAAAIGAGDLFKLIHDELELELVCRCLEKTNPDPTSGHVSLAWTAEKGIAPLPYTRGAAEDFGTAYPPPEIVDHIEIIQLPPAIAGDSEGALAILAARKTAITNSLRISFQAADEALWYELGFQRNFAVTGALLSDYGTDHPADGTNPPDDDTEDLRIDLDADTVAADIEPFTADQGADAVDDGALLLFLVSAANPSSYEICTVKSFRTILGNYAFKVRRARLGTSKIAFVTGDHAWLVWRNTLTAYYHGKFPALVADTGDIKLAIQAATPAEEQAFEDAPQFDFTFADPYAPTAIWTSIKRNGSDWTTFDDVNATTAAYQVAFRANSPTSQLTGAALVARLGGTERLLWSRTYTASATQYCTPDSFTLTSGEWRLYARTTDATGRITEAQLAPVAGGSPVTIKANSTPTTLCSTVTASPAGGEYPSTRTVTLSCVTAPSTILYQITNAGAAPEGTWTTYTDGSPISVATGKTLHMKGQASGMSDSATTAETYLFAAREEQPRGSYNLR